MRNLNLYFLLSSTPSSLWSIMSAAGSVLKQQLHKIAAEWPGDPFRPNIQLKTFFAHLAEHPNLTPAAVRAARALHEDEYIKKVSSYYDTS